MCWRRRRRPTARSCAAAAARRRASRSNGRRSPTSGSCGRHFRQARVFTKGPFRRFGPVFDLEPVELPDGAVGSKVSYALDWEPLTLMGRLFGARLARQAGEVVGKRILEAVAFAKGERATISTCRRPSCPHGARERAAALAAEIDRSPYGNGLGRPLADRVLTAMATDLAAHQAQAAGARARRRRSAPRSRAASPRVRAGLLTMKWDLLCTNCRGAQGERRRAERAAARRALPVLQHRLRPRLREERRALLRARAHRAAAVGRRLLPLGPDGDAARAGAAPAGAGRDAQR